ncbi:hypothetical protein ACA910_014533 [Epithemia clementina (nom. ined.)]
MSDRNSLLQLYRKILRSAQSYPSIRQPQIYQAIREEWRQNKTLEGEKLQKQIAVAYKGLEQLLQFEVVKMTKGNVKSPNWDVYMEENPMPKPADYDERKRRRNQLLRMGFGRFVAPTIEQRTHIRLNLV